MFYGHSWSLMKLNLTQKVKSIYQEIVKGITHCAELSTRAAELSFKDQFHGIFALDRAAGPWKKIACHLPFR